MNSVPTGEQFKHQRRWIQFGLRGLLASTLAAALLSAWFAKDVASYIQSLQETENRDAEVQAALKWLQEHSSIDEGWRLERVDNAEPGTAATAIAGPLISPHSETAQSKPAPDDHHP